MRESSQRGGMHPSSRRLGLFRGIHSCAENGPITCFIVHSHKKRSNKRKCVHSFSSSLLEDDEFFTREKFFAIQPCESTEFVGNKLCICVCD